VAARGHEHQELASQQLLKPAHMEFGELVESERSPSENEQVPQPLLGLGHL
jgi:hypothetical protein